MKIIDSFWFTNPTTSTPEYGTVGIVVVEDDITGDRKAYVGTARGASEKADGTYICEWGTTFSPERVEELLRLLKKERK